MNLKSVLKIVFIIILIFVILFGVLSGAYIAYTIFHKKKEIKDIFEDIETEEVSVSEYIVYGTHLNIKGNLSIQDTDIKNISLELKTSDDEVSEEIKLKYENTDRGIEFSTSELINEGIDLEKLKIDTYYIFLKVEYLDDTYKYYTLKDNTDYEKKEIEYYTITKNGKNNKIDIKFAKHTKEEQKLEYMNIEVNNCKLPANVYDIVIDPGHGGSDCGAKAGGYQEADLTLKIAKEVTEELKKLGFKVKMTRDGTEGEEYSVYTVYDKDGRVNVVGDSKAKYVFSIHLNSVEQANSQSGVEIYAPTKINLKLAKAFAANIVKYADTIYSKLDVIYRVDEGIYVRTFTKNGIEESAKEARKKGYEPYNITEDTPYLYMLRETGGIATGAYVDGRNKTYGTNLYCHSNIGIESYLLELGYINNRTDLQNILNNQKGYVEGIINTIKENILQ